ncbi:MAG: TCR/Tet family MFS transporter [Gammaproteobacteria bacterium]|nr:TCR/Tet family MFS transporter [Gammaproteobacteria bacterium]MCZ6854892.1 TCR/Tet family MFS transporter [Gammaproteobacteria bacterium]
MASKNVSKKLALIFIFITVLLDAIGFGIILPVLPELVMEVTGEGLSQAARYGGWLMFTYAGMQFVSAPIMGNLSDRFGRRPVLLFSLVAFGLDYLLMGWAPSLGWLFLGRFIAGISASTYGIANAYIADVFPPEERAQNFGLLGAAFGAGFIIGPVIGGFLGELGPRVPFYATAAIAFANAVYGFFLLPETLKKENRRPFEIKRANPVGAMNQLSKYPIVIGLVGANFLYLLGHHSLPAIWSYYMIEKFSWSGSDIGLSLGAVGVLMLFVQGYLIRLVIPKFGPERVAYIGLVLTTVSFVGYALAPFGWVVYVFIVFGAGQGFVGPAVQAIVSARIPADSQGELQGAIGSIGSLALILSPPFMTQLFGFFTEPGTPVYFPGAAFMAAAMLTLLSLSVFARVLFRNETTQQTS